MNKSHVTRLINAAARGDQRASEKILPLVYDELRKLARARMRSERPGLTLQPTALVHEAYMKLVGDDINWDNRRHFFAAAAETMRRILIDRARRYAAVKHGGELRRTEFDGLQIAGAENIERLIAWDDLLDQLSARDTMMADVVKLRFFAGFTITETAHALDISPRTVNRLSTAAQTWLRAKLDQHRGS